MKVNVRKCFFSFKSQEELQTGSLKLKSPATFLDQKFLFFYFCKTCASRAVTNTLYMETVLSEKPHEYYGKLNLVIRKSFFQLVSFSHLIRTFYTLFVSVVFCIF